MWQAPPDRIVAAQVVWVVNWELILFAVMLSFLIGLGMWCILRVRRWGQHEEALTPQEELAGHRALLEQGLLTREEFERVRARLEGSSPQASSAPDASAPDARDQTK